MLFDGSHRARRKPSLTPMIDVVFLLLVFFMLASRFGMDSAIQMPLASAGGNYTGPPRMVGIFPESLTLNGVEITQDELADALTELTEKKTDTIILRGKDKATLQRLIDVSQALKTAGFATMVLVE